MAQDFLANYAIGMPGKPAIIDDRPGAPVRSMTFGELDSYVNTISNAMLAVGVEPGDKVLFCGQNSLELMAFTHAARKTAAIAVPLNYRLTDEEAGYVAENSDAVFAWIDADLAPQFARLTDAAPALRTVVVFGGDAHEGQIAERDFTADSPTTQPRVAAGPGGSMIYTSGTTGSPKGAVRRGIGNAQQTQGLLRLMGYGPGDTYITTGPLYHSGPLAFANIAALLGNTCVLQNHFDPEDWLRLVHTYRVTSTFAAPTPIRRVCTLAADVFDRYDVSSMKRMIANAAPWPFALKELYLDRFPEDSLWEVYGSTELGINTVLKPEDQRRKPGSCGRPAPYVDIALFDDDGNRVSEANSPGELFVKAGNMFDTYYKAEEKYRSEQRGDYHTVGDIAYYDDEGYIFICDRKKDMIISGGMNIYPAEIEATLEHHPDVYEVAVFGIPSEEWGESVHAVVVPVAASHASEDDVTAFAREHLAGYKVPRTLEFVDELPKTGSGKILKRDLRKPFWEGHRTGVL